MDVFVVTIYAHTHVDDQGKPPKTVEVRVGKNEIKNDDDKIPRDKLLENAFCGRYVQVIKSIFDI